MVVGLVFTLVHAESAFFGIIELAMPGLFKWPAVLEGQFRIGTVPSISFSIGIQVKILWDKRKQRFKRAPFHWTQDRYKFHRNTKNSDTFGRERSSKKRKNIKL